MPYLIYALISLAISYVIQVVFAPKHQPPMPTAFEDLNFPQTDEGTPQVVVFGDCWVEDWTVAALGNFRTTPIRRSSGK